MLTAWCIRQIILVRLNEVNLSARGPGIASLVLLKKQTEQCDKLFWSSLPTCKSNLEGGNFDFSSLKQMLLQAGIESDKEAFSVSLQPENRSDPKALRILLSVTSAQTIFKWKANL